MADNTITEFLVALGFKVDQAGLKNFGQGIALATKKVTEIAVAIEAAQVVMSAFVTKAADEFEKLYFTSQRAGTSITNLKGLQTGFEHIGLSAEDASSALNSLSLAFTFNPGKEGLMHALGVATRTANGAMRDTSEIELDFIDKLRKMPPMLAAQYAQIFGISEMQLKQMMGHYQELRSADNAWRNEVLRSGVDLEAAGRKSHDFMNDLRDLGNVVWLMWTKISSGLISELEPKLKAFTTYLIDNFGSITDKIQYGLDVFEKFVLYFSDGLVAVVTGIAHPLKQIWDGLDKTNKFFLLAAAGATAFFVAWNLTPIGLATTAILALVAGLGYLIDNWESLMADMREFENWIKGTWIFKKLEQITPDQLKNAPPDKTGHDYDPAYQNPQFIPMSYHPNENGGNGGNPYGGMSPASGVTRAQAALFAGLEKVGNIPAGILDSIWNTESGRGAHMLSGAGAKGHFQFMDATAKRFGLDDPNDLGKSALAAAKYVHLLMQHFGGNIAKALAGYNWGEGKVDKDVARFGTDWMSHLPPETYNYIGKVLGGAALGQSARGGNGHTVNQKTDIHVNGGNDPHRTASEVAVRQRGVNADIIRNLRGAALYS